MNLNQRFSIGKHRTLWVTLSGLGILSLARMAYQYANRFEFRDKVVLITGGSRGLGLELARNLARRGARVAICARTQQQLDTAAKELASFGAEVLTIQADLTSETQAQYVCKNVIGHFGQLDVLINNAGGMLVAPENVLSVADYQQVMDQNVWSALYMINAAVPHFRQRGQGRIANICSIGGKISVPHMLPYSVSKFALTGLSEGLCAELRKDNIHVTTVVPNLMRTGSPRNVTLKGDHQAEYSWFKISDSLPGLSQSAESAAAEIVRAISLGKREVVLTPIARLVTGLQGLAPGAVTALSQVADRMMPQSRDQTEKKGYESETAATTSVATALTDEAAIKNNELNK